MNKQIKTMYKLLREYEAMPPGRKKADTGYEVREYFGVKVSVDAMPVVSAVDNEWIVDNFVIKIKGHDRPYHMIVLEPGIDHSRDCYKRGPFCLYRTTSCWIVLDKHGNLSLLDKEPNAIQIDQETGRRID